MKSPSRQDDQSFRRDLRYRRFFGLGIVLWELRFRLVAGANIDHLVQLFRNEIESHVRAGRIVLAVNETIPSDRTLRRILEDIAQAAYSWTKQLEGEIKRFRKIYDRHVTKRLQLVEIDCLIIDHRLLATKGVDFVALDEAGTLVVEPVAMNAIDRKSKACVGAPLFPRFPVSFDTLGVLKDLILGRLAPELGRCGVPAAIRFDHGTENSATDLVPVLRRIHSDVHYARPKMPYDKPTIERFNGTIGAHFKFKPQDIRSFTTSDGRVLQFVTYATLVKRYEAARRSYNHSRPQRPPNAPTRIDRWCATVDRVADSKFNPEAVEAHLYFEYVLSVAGKGVTFGNRVYSHPDFESHEKIKARVYPNGREPHIYFFDLQGNCFDYAPGAPA